VYDNFTERMLQYAQEQDSASPGWARRSFPFPDHTLIVAMGYSHTGQVLEAVL